MMSPYPARIMSIGAFLSTSVSATIAMGGVAEGVTFMPSRIMAAPAEAYPSMEGAVATMI